MHIGRLFISQGCIVMGLLLLHVPGFSQNSQVLLRSVIHTSPPYIDYWSYDAAGRPVGIVSTTRDSSSVIMFYQFKRDKQYILRSTEVMDVSRNIIYSFEYHYNKARQIDYIEKFSDMDYDGKADDLDHKFSFTYDSLGRVAGMRIVKGYTVARLFSFTWQGGNIIKVENTDGELNYWMNISYDHSANMLEPIKWEYLTTTGTLEFYVTMFSSNNIISATLYPAAMDSVPINIRPEYYDDGMYKTNYAEGVEYEYLYK